LIFRLANVAVRCSARATGLPSIYFKIRIPIQVRRKERRGSIRAHPATGAPMKYLIKYITHCFSHMITTRLTRPLHLTHMRDIMPKVFILCLCKSPMGKPCQPCLNHFTRHRHFPASA
jgi:hypothetical protein